MYNPLAFGLMLVGMGALVFAAYLYRKYRGDLKEEKAFGAIFLLFGLLAASFGLSLWSKEPIPAQYIEVYGVGYLVFALLMVIAGLCMLFNWEKRPASYLAALGGILLLHSSYTIEEFALSKSPTATMMLFLLAGVGSLSAVLLTHLELKEYRKLFLAIIAIFAIAGALALYSGLSAQSGHIARALAG